MKPFASFAPSRLTLLGASLIAMVACSGDDDGGGDWPDKLYLALEGGETAVRLAEEPPEPY